MLDQAFDALKTYDWGKDPNQLKAIDDAVIASHGDAAARKALETRLAAVLKTDAPLDAKDFVCRKLMIIGTAESTPTLGSLLGVKEHAHMARFALERMPAAEAGQVLREALPKTSGALKIGVISSLGVRKDAASVPALAALLGDSDAAVARAAALALGDIHNADAAKALADAKAATPAVKTAVTDARLSCADALLGENKKTEALALYKTLAGDDQPKHVRLAATRGMLACAGKK